MTIVEFLSDWGYAVVEASSATEAEQVLESSEKLDLLITDIRLGDADGSTVAGLARAARPNIPIIYMSGYPTDGERLPRTAYVCKPFRLDELGQAIRALLGGTEHDGLAVTG